MSYIKSEDIKGHLFCAGGGAVLILKKYCTVAQTLAHIWHRAIADCYIYAKFDADLKYGFKVNFFV